MPSAGRVGPGRWEVAVFKLPEEPEVRYIKRLVGMPEEVIRIQQGDLWRQAASQVQGEFERLRRPIGHQQAMQITVYDDSHRAASLKDDPTWRRWTPADRGWSEPVGGDIPRRRIRESWGWLARASLSQRRTRPRPVEGHPRWPAAAGSPASDPDHRLLVVQHRPHAAGPPASPVRGPAVVPAPLGGRPHALLPRDGARTAGPAQARADQGRPVEPVRDRSGHRPGHALPRRSQQLGEPASTPLKARREPTSSCWPTWTTG